MGGIGDNKDIGVGKKWPVQVPLHWSQLALPQGLAGSGILGKGKSVVLHYTTEVVVDVHFYTMNDSMMHPYNKQVKAY